MEACCGVCRFNRCCRSSAVHHPPGGHQHQQSAQGTHMVRPLAPSFLCTLTPCLLTSFLWNRPTPGFLPSPPVVQQYLAAMSWNLLSLNHFLEEYKKKERGGRGIRNTRKMKGGIRNTSKRKYQIHVKHSEPIHSTITCLGCFDCEHSRWLVLL